MSRSKNAVRTAVGLSILVVLGALMAGPAVAADDLKVYWNNGLNFKNAEKGVSLKIGGRIQNDWGWFNKNEDFIQVTDGTEFRRARLYMSGDLGGNVFFKSQIDFSSRDKGGAIADEVTFKDMYMGIKGIPVVGRFIVGQMKEPYSLEEMTSSNYITMMERSTIAAFDSERNTGFMLQNHWLEERLVASLGMFLDSGPKGGSRGNNNYNWSGRVTGLPWQDKEKRQLLHLGLSASLRRTLSGELEYGTRPSSHFAPAMVETEVIPSDQFTLSALETAVVLGPFSAQSELKTSMANSESFNDPRISGYYVMASYFLTGESRPYKYSDGCFDRVKPNKPMGEGAGAWQIAARYSYIDLTEGDGGKMDDYVLGLNWYLNNNARVMLNYVYSETKDRVEGDTKFSGFQTRFAVYY